jgi:futalosine hydrolase
MTDRARILVVAATARELTTGDGWRTLRCGVGPVEAAASTALAIAEHRPAAVLHVGVAGARRARALAATTLVVGSEARYCDLPANIPAEWAPRTVEATPALVAAARRVLPDAVVLPIGTSARVGGTSAYPGCDVEAMEGFGVLRAAQLAGIPAVEVRAISNDVEDERARWRLDDAFAAITSVTPLLVQEILQCVS